MLKIGVTGSIGMGKSTTAKMFAEFGGVVHDADEAVARLYAPGGAAVQVVASLVPNAVVAGAIDRGRLRERVLAEPELLAALEAKVHPLVAADRDAFMRQAEASAAPFAIFDIPLLFESGSEVYCDVVVVVTATHETQRRRVLARPGMTQETFDTILARQTPDAEKRRRADYVIDTTDGLDAGHAQVVEILKELSTTYRLDLDLPSGG